MLLLYVKESPGASTATPAYLTAIQVGFLMLLLNPWLAWPLLKHFCSSPKLPMCQPGAHCSTSRRQLHCGCSCPWPWWQGHQQSRLSGWGEYAALGPGMLSTGRLHDAPSRDQSAHMAGVCHGSCASETRSCSLEGILLLVFGGLQRSCLMLLLSKFSSLHKGDERLSRFPCPPGAQSHPSADSRECAPKAF